MMELDWELLAVMEIASPEEFDYIIWELAELKREIHGLWVEDRMIWEHFNPSKIRGGFAGPQEGEPFVGERYDA